MYLFDIVTVFSKHFTLYFKYCLLNPGKKIVSYRADPLSNLVLTFSTKEDAVAFAEKNGMFAVFVLL